MKIAKHQPSSNSNSLKFYSLFAIIFFNATITLAQPTASNPVSVDVECIGDVPAPDVLVVTDETDNCTGTPVVAWENDISDGNTCPEVITRTYSVSDDCGNSINVTQTITVNDNIAPVLAAPPVAITVQCIGDVPAMTNLGWTDNCDGSGSVAGTDGALVGGACGGTITRTWTYTDACGNVATTTQTITVDDNINPTASNPATTTVPGGPAPAVDVNVVIDEADNCSVPVVAFVSESTDGAACPETITRIYSVMDACGNTINVTHIILITDPIFPTASNPVGINVECIAAVPSPDITVVTDEADNQGVPTVAWVGDVSDGNTCPETITRTYSVMDDCGNVTTVTQTITVNDITPPTASNPPAINAIGSAPSPDPLVVTDEADNCTVNPVVTWEGDISDGMTDPETITRTYCVTDDCGNQTCVTQSIIVGSVGLSETELTANIKVFPNPTNGFLTIQLEKEYNDVEVKVRNILGEVIQFSKYDAAAEIELTLNDSPGFYFVGIRSSMNQEVFIRVVKE